MSLFMIKSQADDSDSFVGEFYHFFDNILTRINCSTMSQNLVILVDRQLYDNPFLYNLLGYLI